SFTDRRPYPARRGAPAASAHSPLFKGPWKSREAGKRGRRSPRTSPPDRPAFEGPREVERGRKAAPAQLENEPSDARRTVEEPVGRSQLARQHVPREENGLVEVGGMAQNGHPALLDEPGEGGIRMAPANEMQGREGTDDVPDRAEPDEQDPETGHRASIRGKGGPS